MGGVRNKESLRPTAACAENPAYGRFQAITGTVVVSRSIPKHLATPASKLQGERASRSRSTHCALHSEPGKAAAQKTSTNWNHRNLRDALRNRFINCIHRRR